jgi:hypothetical protein
MPRMVALIRVVMSLVPLGCATGFRPGLANAPQLGGSPLVDVRVHDAIANGRDSCEQRLGSGPLRNEVPACAVATPVSNPAVAIDAVGAANESPPNAAAIWRVKPYSDRGSCPSWDNRMGRLTVAEGFAFFRTTAATCTTPL